MPRWIAAIALWLAAAGAGIAAPAAGAIVRAQGEVLVAHGKGSFAPAQAGEALFAGDRVRTGADGRALLKIGRARVMLAPRSEITVRSETRARFGFGEVFVRVLRRLRARLEFRVETNNAVLGVRGTTFAVAGETDRIKVLLKEGRIEARAKRGKFRRHKGPPPSFAEFVREQEEGVRAMEQEFEAYLQQTQREFAAFVRAIVLEAGQGLVLAGQDAWTFKLTEKDLAGFAAFEQWLKEGE
ncbi:MAG: hypothetical protein D6771_01740 [Zetaproteobacteria bacterium]|nr:MAG: hypothetical protein D6771_01740 [Zetaproteobacteria bacterium]